MPRVFPRVLISGRGWLKRRERDGMAEAVLERDAVLLVWAVQEEAMG